jgi:hypothetical protein
VQSRGFVNYRMSHCRRVPYLLEWKNGDYELRELRVLWTR